jgi:hypothetical protein
MHARNRPDLQMKIYVNQARLRLRFCDLQATSLPWIPEASELIGGEQILTVPS